MRVPRVEPCQCSLFYVICLKKKWVPFTAISRLGNKKKVDGAKSEIQGGLY